MQNKKRFQFISSCILALCLVCSLVLSGNTFGVRAEEDTQQASQTQETQQETNEDSAKETSKDSDSKTDAAKQSADDSKKSNSVATQADTSSSNDVETAAETTYEFYIDQGSISFTATGVTGYIKDGDTYTQKTISCPATKEASDKTLFVITQTADSYDAGTTNNISFSGNQTIPYRVLLKNVHMSSPSVNKNPDTSGHATNEKGMILIPAQTNHTKSVSIYLKGENILTGIRYYTGSMYTPSSWNKNSSLTIDSAVSGSDSGSLYIPKKVAASDIETFVKSNESYNHWNAGIGGTDPNEVTDGIHINGGTLQVLTTYGDNCSAIGGGGNGDSTIEITGGNITAISSGTGAAIGGGIGYSVQGGVGDVTISGGKVDARNYKTLQSGDLTVGGVAIGGGSSFKSAGSSATVNITGGDITAYADYGNAIGGGNSAQNTAGAATLNISGGTVKTSAIGGGSSETSVGGNAEIIANGGSVKCEKRDTFIGAFGIGGGTSKAGNGGTASVTVNNGTLDCGDGVIGGGTSKSGGKGGNADIIVKQGNLIAGKIGGGNAEDANTAYAGGDASIYVSGGTLDCASIGGGNSTLGTPGAVNSNKNAGVTVTGGTVKTGTIGGGTNKNGDIGFATADISGGTIQGQFILANTDSSKKCTFKMTDGTIDNSGLGSGKYVKAQKNGGAVYLTDANGEVTLNGGTIKNSTGTLGGAIYLAGEQGKVSMGGTDLENCSAENGGGVYVKGGTLTMTSGKLTGNTATEKGGGAYVSGGNFKLNGKDAAVSCNTAQNGAGIYLTGGKPELLAGSLTANTVTENGGGIYIDKQDVTFAPTGTVTVSENSAVNGGGVYIGGTKSDRGGLSVDKDSTGSMQFLDNTASASGGGACVDYGSFELDSDKVTMQGNSAANGGGVAVLNGSFTQSGGTIGGSSDKINTADNGGAVYVSGGDFTLNDGKIQNNSAKNGGGVFAAEGKVRMFGGSITNNTATADGGGMYVSSTGDPADVVLRSGTLSSNTAGNSDAKTGNGGGLAVVSSQGSQDHVIIGLNETHPDLNTSTRKFDAFNYTDEADNKSHNHASCMVMENNLANGKGGGIYMGSTGATLDIFCLLEKGNESKDNKDGGSVMATGGQVNIGDSGNNNKDAGGNIVIDTPMLVSGGTVDIWGNMKNPYFGNNILVDIKENTGRFTDHRTSTDEDDHHYKVQYFENFFGSGIYSAMQYSTTETITALGTLFTHEGYKIKEWNTEKDGTGKSYPIGTKIGSATDHSAWTNGVNDPLILYAIWEKVKYTVKYDPNATEYTAVTPMADQTFEYGVEQELASNTYRVTGKRFTGWNTEKDGSGTAYAADYKDSKMTQEDGSTITLYAQWVDCTHKDGEHPGEITYTTRDGDTIVESCDCGGHTASAKITATDVYHDGSAHPAKVTTSGTFLTSNTPQVTYQYRETEDGAYGALKDGETEPTSIGYYKATMTLEGQTVTVTYQIKSPGEGFTVDGKGAAGQVFDDFNGTDPVTAAKDDAVTLQYIVQKVNGETYQTAPQLTFDSVLPSGTKVIMETDGSYWYCNSLAAASAGKTTVELSDFTAMGGTAKFAYDTSDATKIAKNQEYRFVLDFSQVAEADRPSGDVKATFSYQYTDHPDTDLKSGSVTINFGDAGSFAVTNPYLDKTRLKITAPEAADYSRWANRSLVLRIAAADGSGASGGATALPSDAKLTVVASGKTQSYNLTRAGEFIVPLSWAEAQDAVFSLDSDLAAQAGSSWELTAKLFMAPGPTGISGATLVPAFLYDTGASETLKLQIPADDSPSLRITGNKHLLTNSEELPVTIEMKNVGDATVHATIQKKSDKGSDYAGNFLDANVQDGANSFNLGGITEAGSYRLLVTVTKNNQTLLSVPYYFVVK